MSCPSMFSALSAFARSSAGSQSRCPLWRCQDEIQLMDQRTWYNDHFPVPWEVIGRGASNETRAKAPWVGWCLANLDQRPSELEYTLGTKAIKTYVWICPSERDCTIISLLVAVNDQINAESKEKRDWIDGVNVAFVRAQTQLHRQIRVVHKAY